MPDNAQLESDEVRSTTDDRLQTLLTICQKMSTEHDLAKLLELLAREATRLMQADRARIFLLERDRNALWSQVAQLEKQLIRDALQQYHNNKQQTARALGLSLQVLLKKLKRYGIEAA